MRRSGTLCLTVFFFFAGSMAATAQLNFTDSLRMRVRQAPNDSVRAKELIELGNHYSIERGNTDSAKTLYRQAQQLASAKKIVSLQVKALLRLCTLYSSARDRAAFDAVILELAPLQTTTLPKSLESDILREKGMGHLRMAELALAKTYFDSAAAIANRYNLKEEQAKNFNVFANLFSQTNIDSCLLMSRLLVSSGKELNNAHWEGLGLEYIAFYYRGFRLDTAMVLYKEAINLYNRNGLERDLLYLYSTISTMWVLLEDSIRQHVFHEGLRLAGRRNSAIDSLNLLQATANALVTTGDYPAALQRYLTALDISSRLGRRFETVANLSYVGSLYQEQGDHKKSLRYLYSARQLAGNAYNESLIWIYNLLAANHLETNHPDSATYYMDKSYQLAKQVYDKQMPAWVANDIGNQNVDAGRYDFAKQMLLPAYPVLVREGEPYNLCIATFALAKLYDKTGKNDSCLRFAHETLNIATEKGMMVFKVKAANLLVDHYRRRHMMDSAFHYLELATAARDGLFNQEKQRQLSDVAFADELRKKDLQQQLETQTLHYKNKVNTYLFAGGIALLLLVAAGLFYNNRQKQKAKTKIEQAYAELKATQAQLIQSEKMASLGELTAGIAHEIQNPLNFVNNFSEINNELIEELKTCLSGKQGQKEQLNAAEQDELLTDIFQNNEKITLHGKRADAIVKGMLQHSRKSTGEKEPTDINALAEEYLKLAYHGMRAKDKSFNVTMKTDFDAAIGKINVIPQDIGRVLLNIYTNALYAAKPPGALKGDYNPTVEVTTKKAGNKVIITISDNGSGIPDAIKDKIFQPFFTTKPTGQGTGLGLSLAYDIVKAHGGEIRVDSTVGEGTSFTVTIPV